MCQIAAAQISHFKINVAQIKSGQISTTEIKTLKTINVGPNVNSTWSIDGINENTCMKLYLTAEL